MQDFIDHKENEKLMEPAIYMAQKGAEAGEVPVGAVLYKNKKIIATAHNLTITSNDPTAHAEIEVIRHAALKLGNYRLTDTCIYVTAEPCIMCMGAIVHARIAKLVFGAFDPKWGAAGSLYDLTKDSRLNHKVQVVKGVCKDRCIKILQDFFRQRRKGD